MSKRFLPSSFFHFPSLWDEEDSFLSESSGNSGLSIYEENEKVCIEAAMPGLEDEDIEISIDKGTLWIKGQKKEEKKERKFYRKATSSYTYHISMPSNIDESKEPEATYEHGIMKIIFTKKTGPEPKKIKFKRK